MLQFGKSVDPHCGGVLETAQTEAFEVFDRRANGAIYWWRVRSLPEIIQYALSHIT